MGNTVDNTRVRYADITGQRFGRLTVLRKSETKQHNRAYHWLCRCDCGNERYVAKDKLIRGTTKSCGCYMADIIKKGDALLIGKRFGRLTVIKKTNTKNSHDAYLWLCRCDCGNEHYVRKGDLTHGTTKSCGCYKADIDRKGDDLFVGKRFGRLTVIEKSKVKKSIDTYLWLCKCDCGNEHYITKSSLNSGVTKSCGCLYNEQNEIMRTTKTHPDVISTSKLWKNNTSGIRGVSKTRQGTWSAFITFQGKKYYLGSFVKKEDAAVVRKEAERNLFGPFLDWYEENIKSLPNRKETTKT